MMDWLRDNLAVIVAFGTGLGAYFRLKSDNRSLTERLSRAEERENENCVSLRKNAEDIRELQLQQQSTREHRDQVNNLLEKLDSRMERQDEKMDRMLTAITKVDTKLQERTKELHS